MNRARQSSGGSAEQSLSSEPLSSPELNELREALAKAETEAADAAAEAKRIEAEETAALHVLLGEPNLTAEIWEDARITALSKTEGAEAARDFAGGRVLKLRERAGELAEQIAGERVADAEATLRTATSAVAEAEEGLGLARAAHDRAALALEDAANEAVDLRADFTPELAAARDARRRQDHDLARWHAWHPEAGEQVPRHLRALVEQERDQLERAAADEHRRMELEARESRLRAGYTD